MDEQTVGVELGSSFKREREDKLTSLISLSLSLSFTI